MGYIEKGRAKTITKVILWLLVISFVAAIFVSWGAQNAGIFGSGGTVLSVAGTSVDVNELQMNQNFYRYLRDRLVGINPQEIILWNGAAAKIGGSLAGSIAQTIDMSRSGMDLQYGNIALMVGDIVLAREAAKAGIRITDDEIAKQLALIYRTREGEFLGQETVSRDLARYSIGSDREPRFMELFKRHLQARRYVAAMFSSVASDLDRHARELYEAQNRNATFDSVTFNSIDYLGDLKYGDEELKAYLAEHTGEFAVVEMLRFDTALYTSGLEISEDEITNYYNDHQDSYREPESRDVRRILVPLAQDADEETTKEANALIDKIYNDLNRPGEEFATVARKYSQDPAAQTEEGVIEGLKREGARDQAFVNAAFSLQNPGDFSPSAVRTQDGLEIIQLVAAHEGAVKPLDEVRTEIRDTLAKQRATDDAPGLADQLRSQAGQSADWDGLAEPLYITHVPEAVAIEGEKEIFLVADALSPIAEPDDTAPLFQTETGGITNVLSVGDDYAIFRIVTKGDQLDDRFDYLRPAVVRRYTKVESRKLAKAKADEFAAKVRDAVEGANFHQVATEMGATAETSMTTRYQGVFNYGSGFMSKLFSAKVGDVIGPLEGNGTYRVAQLTKLDPIDEAGYEKQKDQLRGDLLNNWVSGNQTIFQALNIVEDEFSDMIDAQVSNLVASNEMRINREILRQLYGSPEQQQQQQQQQ